MRPYTDKTGWATRHARHTHVAEPAGHAQPLAVRRSRRLGPSAAPAYLMPRRRRISATSASRPSSSEPPLTRFAGTLAGAAVVGSTAARSPRPAATATALPLVVASRLACFSSFFL